MRKRTEKSTSDEWETPPEVFDPLQRRYGPFDLDAAATATTAKAPLFFSREQSALTQDWSVGGAVKTVWLNPPYSKPLKELFVKKAVEEAYGKQLIVVCLLPVDTSTALFHDVVKPWGRIEF